MKIKNTEALAKNELRRDALQIAEAGLFAIDTARVVREGVRLEGEMLCIRDEACSLNKVERVFLVGVGKCSARAAAELEDILGEKLHKGIVVDVSMPKECKFKKVECYTGTHPLPSEQNVSIARKIVTLLEEATADDLVLFVISGGGSTLLCLPEEEAKCVEEEAIVSALFKAGASIQEINVVRKHMSYARGGFLAKHAYPAEVISLIFSDVPGDDLQFIASGPTVKDTTTVREADEVLDRYGVLATCNIAHCGLIETPKDDKYFARVKNILFVSNKNALDAMERHAVSLGYNSRIVTAELSGEARDAARGIARELNSAADKRAALLYGGETTVTVKKAGKGGRNQELALAALPYLKDGELILSLATDGKDNTEYAGALCDILTKKDAEEKKLNPASYLNENSSFEFFTKTGDYIKTGPTGSNVADLVIALKN